MKTFFLFLIPLSFAFASPAYAQVEEEDRLAVSQDTVIKIDERRFIYKGRIYRENSPYLTFGYGVGRNFGGKSFEQNMTISYHHFIKGIGLGIGLHSSSDEKIWWRSYQKLNDFYFLLGKKWDGVRYNLAVFAGPSYAYGSYVAWHEVYEKDWAYGYNTVGGLAELQFTYRLFYDLGLGLTAYTSMNKFVKVAGVQFHLFFSTAFVRSYD